MNWWLLTFFIGAILSLFLPEVPAVFSLLLLLCIAVVCFLHKASRSSSGFLFGALWILSQAYLYQTQLTNPLITQMHERQALIIEGEVLSLQNSPKGDLINSIRHKRKILRDNNKISSTKRFNFRVTKINNYSLSRTTIIRLSWKNSPLTINQGQRFTLKVKLKPAHGLANIGSFNYLTWLKAHKISATGYVVNAKKKNKTIQTAMVIDNQSLNQNSSVRQQLFNDYQASVPEHFLKPILLALAFGERSLITPSHWKILQTTGTSHLIAISGLHVGLLASGTYFIVMLILQYFPMNALSIHVLPINKTHWQQLNFRYIAITFSLLLAAVYAYMAGFSLPTQRALIMLLLYWFSRLMGLRLSSVRLLLMTLFIVVIVSPFSLLTPSFWLSFYAVAIIFLSLWRCRLWLSRGGVAWRFIKGLIIIQVALTIMLIPVSALFFHQLSFVSFAANIIAVPWMSFISIPLALLSVIFTPVSEGVSQWFMTICLQSLTGLWQYLVMLAELPYAMVLLSFKQQVHLCLLGAFIFICFYLSPFIKVNRKYKAAMLTTIIIMPLPFLFLENDHGNELDKDELSKYDLVKSDSPSSHSEKSSIWQVVFFDVGQGLSVLIKKNGHAILYDTGAAYPSGFILSQAVVIPYLQHIGMSKLDKVILSHSDNDHAGGLISLAETIPINEIISNDATLATQSTSTCQQGDVFTWQGLTFEYLWPLNDVSFNAVSGNRKQKNDDSCVVLITDNWGNNLLLTGDISKKVERQLMAQYPQLHIDILQVPHHGSKTSSSRAFIKQLSPQYAVASAGYLNRWNMPVPDVSQRYLDENIKLINSAKVGQVIMNIDKREINSRNYVEDLRPFWFSH